MLPVPFAAVQTQLGWAYSNDVNLLAAGSSMPSVGSTGTGIYHGKAGTDVSVMTVGSGERRIYVANVPKYTDSSAKLQRQIKRRSRKTRSVSTRAATTENFFMKRDYLQQYRTLELDLMWDTGIIWVDVNKTVCDGDFCCNFNLQWNPLAANESANASYYSYRLGAYDGWRKEDSGEGNYLRNCGLFSCTGPEIEDCGKLGNADVEHRVIFLKVNIEATYPKSSQFLPMPNSLLDNLLPLEPSQFVWVEEEVNNG